MTLPSTDNQRLVELLHHNGSEAEILALIQSGVDPDAFYTHPLGGVFVSALSLSLMRDFSDQVALTLLAHGANPQGCGIDDTRPPLIAALQSQRLDVVKVLLEKGAHHSTRPDVSAYSIFWNSISWPAVFPLLQQAGLDVNAADPLTPLDKDPKTVLLSAVEQRHMVAVKTLLRLGADASMQGARHSPAWAAIRLRQPAILDELLRCGANPGYGGEDMPCLLHATLQPGEPAMLATLLAGGADPNFSAPGVASPLYRAVEGGALKCVQLLINAGAHYQEEFENLLIVGKALGYEDICQFLNSLRQRDDLQGNTAELAPAVSKKRRF